MTEGGELGPESCLSYAALVVASAFGAMASTTEATPVLSEEMVLVTDDTAAAGSGPLGVDHEQQPFTTLPTFAAIRS